MTTSLPGNVFITTSKEAIEKFLDLSQYKITFDKYLSKLTKNQIERSLICTPNRNSNLIDFEMNYGMGREGNTFILRFVETGSLFELQFLNKDVYTEVISKILLENSQNKNKNQNEIDLTNELADITTSSTDNSRDIFISFGVGDKIDDWAGPFIGVLTKSNFTLTDSGVREITLEFTNQEGKLKRNELEGSRQKNIYSIFDKYTTLYKNKRIKLGFEVNVPYDSIFSEYIHNKITELLTLYIYSIINKADTKTPNKNVIILIPSLKNLFEKTVSKDAVKYGTVESDAINKIGLLGYKKFVDENVIKQLQQELKEIIEYKNIELKAAQRTLEIINRNDLISIYRSWSQESSRMAFNARRILEDVPRNIDVIQKEYDEKITKLASLVIKLDLNDSVKTNPSEFSPDYFSPLSKFNSGLKNQYERAKEGAMNYEPTFLVENDLRILKLWEENGFIQDKTKPAFIFGDSDMIEDLLYVSKSFSNTTAAEFITNKEFISEIDYNTFCKNKQKYRMQMYSLLKANRKSPSFGEMRGGRDDLALSEFNKYLIEFKDYQDIPIFRHNISNPNVLSISINNDTSYLDVYSMGYAQKNIISYISDPTKLNKEFNFDFVEFINQQNKVARGETNIETLKGDVAFKNLYITARLIVSKDPKAQSDINKIYNIIKDLLGSKSYLIKTLKNNEFENLMKEPDSNKNKKAILIAFEVYKNFNKNLTPVIQLLNQQELVAFEKDTFDRLTRTAQNIELKTIPWFSINGYVAGQQCILIGLSNIIGAKQRTEAFYTGLYTINAYRHVITPQEMYSEFNLIKHPVSQANLNDYNSPI